MEGSFSAKNSAKIAGLVYGTGSITADDGEVPGFLQTTPYGSVWAHFIAEAEDSGYLHPDGWNGQRCKHSWEPNGFSWFAQFSAAIAHEEIQAQQLQVKNEVDRDDAKHARSSMSLLEPQMQIYNQVVPASYL